MADYKDEVDTVAHNFNNSTLTLNGETVVDGLEEWSVERDEPEITITHTADGTAVFNESNVRTGTIVFSALEAVASTDALWSLQESKESFSVAFTDSATPNLAAGGKRCRFEKKPITKRGKEAEVVEWTIKVTYLKSKSGSYKLEAE